MYGQDQRYDFTSNSDIRPGLRAINLQSTKPLMALASDSAQQDQRSQQVLKVLSCWQRLAGRQASLILPLLDPLRYLHSILFG
jgi:hypothetical protein